MTTVIDEKDPRAVEGLKELQRRFQSYFRVPRATDAQSIHELKQIVYDFRVHFKNRYGVTFPEITPLALPSIGRVQFYRSDLPNKEIRQNILYLIEGLKRVHLEVSAVELAAAIQRAWPHYRPEPEELIIKPEIMQQ